MNLNAYGFGPPEERQWIIVDIGVTFNDPRAPGVDVVMPDPTFLEGERDRLLGIVLTHAHEDHIGAIGRLWPRLRAPIYATPFTAILTREKLKEGGCDGEAVVHEVALGGRITLGPFDIELVTLTHSIPEPNGLAIRTPLGLVMHTGDWKIDPDPLIGDLTDEAMLRRLGQDGVLAMVCDSTNALVEGTAGSESDVRRTLAEVIRAQPGKVAVAAFASNVARLESAMYAARDCGRSIVLAGRSMHRIVGAARSIGLLADMHFVDEEEAGYLPDQALLYLCTGSQGEPRAALARIAAGNHPHVKLGQGDSVLFSSRVIPGNEVAIGSLQNALTERGVKVITDRDFAIHTSGHPCRDDLRQMYHWVRPQIAIPVHGEARHIAEHAALARTLQVPQVMEIKNGDLLRLAPGLAAVIDETPHGRLAFDGKTLVEIEARVFRDRRIAGQEGVLAVSLVMNRKGAVLSGPDVRLRGLGPEDEAARDRLLDQLETAAEEAIKRAEGPLRQDEDALEQMLARTMLKTAIRLLHKRPLVEATVHLL
ncbi:MAG TPA: MBL fold metallo-hydrolase [Hyphomonadaceae bacterium]|nr:MBL fold metallo-hydrolase [Hyphomonadaceae bacterium]